MSFMYVGDQEITSYRQEVLVEKLKVLVEYFGRKDIMASCIRLFKDVNIYAEPDSSLESFLCETDKCLVCGSPLTEIPKLLGRICKNENCAGLGLTTLSQLDTTASILNTAAVVREFDKILGRYNLEKEVAERPYI